MIYYIDYVNAGVTIICERPLMLKLPLFHQAMIRMLHNFVCSANY